MQKRTIIAGLGITAALVVSGTTGAVASNLIGSQDIRDGGVHRVDLGRGVQHDLSTDLTGLDGAFYAQAFYNAGDTNAGAVATVACSSDADSQDFVAISGGVQTLALDGTPLDNNTPVASSFPGRMDWSTNTPKADRLDGWIVQFGGNAGPVSDVAPERVKVWALCVPGADIPTVNTFTQVG